MLLHEGSDFGLQADLAVCCRAFALGKDRDQCILGQLAALVVFVSRTELLNDAAYPVGVSVAAPSQPNAPTLIDAFDFAVCADQQLWSACHRLLLLPSSFTQNPCMLRPEGGSDLPDATKEFSLQAFPS